MFRNIVLGLFVCLFMGVAAQAQLGGPETGFALGDKTLKDDFGLNRWGWVNCIKPSTSVDCTYEIRPIYAGAGQNDPDRGTEVGYIGFFWDGQAIKLFIQIYPEYQLLESHVNLVTRYPKVIGNPGEYNMNDSLVELGSNRRGDYAVYWDNRWGANGGTYTRPVYLTVHVVVDDAP